MLYPQVIRACRLEEKAAAPAADGDGRGTDARGRNHRHPWGSENRVDRGLTCYNNQ